MPKFYAYILCLHSILIFYAYILHLHSTPTFYTYILYLHSIPTFYTYILRAFIHIHFLYFVCSYWSPFGCLPRWRIGECSPDMEGAGEIKYPGQTKTSTAVLRLTERSVKDRGKKPRRNKISWSSRLGVI
jgi:hypothetical protein